MASINVVSQGENDLLAAALRRAFAMAPQRGMAAANPVAEALALSPQGTPTAAPGDYAMQPIRSTVLPPPATNTPVLQELVRQHIGGNQQLTSAPMQPVAVDNGRYSAEQNGGSTPIRPTKVSDVTYEQWMQATRRAHEAGDTLAAKRLAKRAIDAKDREQGQRGNQKMARFEVKAADGTIYEVDAPDERAAVDAMKRMTANEKPNTSPQANNWRQDTPLAENSGASRMIEVDLPDGSIAEFPEGTSDEVMKDALQRWWEDAPRAADVSMNPEQKKALALAAARRRRAQDEAQEPAQGSFNIPSYPGNQPQVQERGIGQRIYDNVIGDPNDGVESFGERAGQTINDMGRSAFAGAARGTVGLADLPGLALNAGSGLGTWVAEQTGLASPGQAQATREFMTDSARPRVGDGSTMRNALSGATGGGSEFRGNTTAGQYAGTIGEFIPSAIMMGGNMPANALRYGAVPGAASEAAGQMTEGTSIEPWARAGAAITAAPLTGLVERGGRRMVSPYGGADQGRLGLAQVLEDVGVPVSAGQRVGSEALRRKEGMSSAGQALNETQREALTRAALRTVGTNADRATPEVLADTARRIGSVFDDVARGADVTPDPATVNALAQANQTYRQLAPKSSQVPIIGEIVKRTTGAFRSGQSIPATTVNSWRSNLSKLTTSNDGATRTAAIDAMNAIDDAMASTLTNMGRADDVARLATAREQWRNFLAIQRAATGAGEETAAGILSPSALRSAVVQQGRASYAQGQRGELGNLARAAEGVIKPLPTSGTAENIRALGTPALGWSAAGAGVGAGLGGGPFGAALGSMAGAVVPGILGAARMSRPIQNWLSNQTVGTGGPVLPRNALSPVIAALLGSR